MNYAEFCPCASVRRSVRFRRDRIDRIDLLTFSFYVSTRNEKYHQQVSLHRGYSKYRIVECKLRRSNRFHGGQRN
ncbi:hypothetical protein V1478_007259 [Vespula squamosa]|uniref:Uncharacterized protein n=1 Tax=Vespula squamosa TaxID=30214 RepID=A0ABD2B2U3_VESSQ